MRSLTNWALALLSIVLIVVGVRGLIIERKSIEPPLDRTEEMEKARINQFFSELDAIYGYFSSTEDESIKLYLKIDEALREGELSGSLLVITDTDETEYELAGITDGKMLEFFTTDNGKDIKMEGKFHTATDFELFFWMTDETLSFRAITEEDFKEVAQ